MNIIRLLVFVIFITFGACSEQRKEAHVHQTKISADHQHEREDGHDHELTSIDADHAGDADDHVHAAVDHADGLNEHDDAEVVAFDESWEKLIGMESVVVRRQSIEKVISAPGQIIPNPDRIAVITPFVESGVNRVFVNVGDRVHRGDMLVCLLSPEIGLLRAEYDKAKAELDIISQNFNRKKMLFDENIISEKIFLEAELEKRIADVDLEYARKRLLSVGVSLNELDFPPAEHSEASGATIHLKSPISGIITERNAKIGQKVAQQDQLFEIIDLKEIWIEADIFEKDLKHIRIGQQVKARVSAHQDDVFTGIIFHIGSRVSDQTKSIKILSKIDNENETLKPGMFASANIIVGVKENALVIPKSATLEDENLQIVFVKEQNGHHRHIVQTGIFSDEYVEITAGLREGDVVVTKGNYQLKSKSRMRGMDPHAGHNH